MKHSCPNNSNLNRLTMNERKLSSLKLFNGWAGVGGVILKPCTSWHPQRTTGPTFNVEVMWTEFDVPPPSFLGGQKGPASGRSAEASPTTHPNIVQHRSARSPHPRGQDAHTPARPPFTITLPESRRRP